MKTINYLKVLCLFCLLVSAKTSMAQTCTPTFSGTTGISGSATFYAYAPGNSSITPGTFSWNFGNGSTASGVNMTQPAITYTANGVYTITLTYTNSATSCSAVVTQTLAISNAGACSLIANFGTAQGFNGYFSFGSTSSGVVPGATYTWDYGDGSPTGSGNPSNHTYASPGNYFVTLTVDNNIVPTCTASVSYTLNYCSPATTVASTSYSNGVEQFTATAIPSSTATVYNWSFGDGNYYYGTGAAGSTPTHTYGMNSVYSVSVSISTPGAITCSAIVIYTVNVSNIINPCILNASFGTSQGASGLVNFYNSTTGTSGGVTYSWNFGDGGTSASTSPVHTYAANGSYVVTLTANNNYSYTCTDTYTATVVVNSYCASSFSFVTGAAGTVTLTASPGTASNSAYSWNFGNGQTTMGSGNQNVTYLSNGVYTVTATYSVVGTGCSSTTTQTISITNAGCNLTTGFSVTTYSIAGSAFFSNTTTGWNPSSTASWNFGDGNTATTAGNASIGHAYAANGTYIVTLTVDNNLSPACVSTQTAQVVITSTAPCVADASFSMAPTATAQVWYVVPGAPGSIVNVVWNWGDGSTSNTLYTNHTYSAAGTYTICMSVTVACGNSTTSCSSYAIYRGSKDMSMIQVIVVDPATLPGGVTGLTNYASEEIGYSVSPNPNNGSFSIRMSGLDAKDLSISVYNLVGKQVYAATGEAVNGSLAKIIDLGGVAEGVYFIQVNSGSNVLTKKVVIQKQ